MEESEWHFCNIHALSTVIIKLSYNSKILKTVQKNVFELGVGLILNLS